MTAVTVMPLPAAGKAVNTSTRFNGRGQVVLTATDATQYAWEEDVVSGVAQNSVFTRYLVQGLETGEADIDADGWITLDEWYNYVYDQVTKEISGQTPGKWAHQLGELPPIAKSPLRPLEEESEVSEKDLLALHAHRNRIEAMHDELCYHDMRILAIEEATIKSIFEELNQFGRDIHKLRDKFHIKKHVSSLAEIENTLGNARVSVMIAMDEQEEIRMKPAKRNKDHFFKSLMEVIRQLSLTISQIDTLEEDLR